LFLFSQIEVEKVSSLSQQLENSCKERNVAVTEINLLKQQLEEMEQAFRQEISNLKEEHQLEIETNSKITTLFLNSCFDLVLNFVFN